jgi:hypothetical protein
MSLRPESRQWVSYAAPLIVIPENIATGRPHSAQFFPLSARQRLPLLPVVSRLVWK